SPKSARRSKQVSGCQVLVLGVGCCRTGFYWRMWPVRELVEVIRRAARGPNTQYPTPRHPILDTRHPTPNHPIPNTQYPTPDSSHMNSAIDLTNIDNKRGVH